jgi:hypothetical protein
LEEKELKKKWEEEFKKTSDYALRGKGKPTKTTTAQAKQEGLGMRRLKHLADTGRNGDGAKTRYETGVKDNSFKDNSVFTEILSEEWDLIMRVAADPAHELYNLVKDILSLICNKGNMSLKASHLEWEKKYGRFKDVASSAQAPWVASTGNLQEVENVVTGEGHTRPLLRYPTGWPTNAHYFGADIKKGKGSTMYSDVLLHVYLGIFNCLIIHFMYITYIVNTY